MAEMVRIIGEHDECDVLLGIDSLGKEDVLVAIAQHFHVPVPRHITRTG